MAELDSQVVVQEQQASVREQVDTSEIINGVDLQALAQVKFEKFKHLCMKLAYEQARAARTSIQSNRYQDDDDYLQEFYFVIVDCIRRYNDRPDEELDKLIRVCFTSVVCDMRYGLRTRRKVQVENGIGEIEERYQSIPATFCDSEIEVAQGEDDIGSYLESIEATNELRYHNNHKCEGEVRFIDLQQQRREIVDDKIVFKAYKKLAGSRKGRICREAQLLDLYMEADSEGRVLTNVEAAKLMNTNETRVAEMRREIRQTIESLKA